tara:strand:+ start:1990 stop:2916 length:927 start_codon:yes stop_codon:yes gene_type:complete
MIEGKILVTGTGGFLGTTVLSKLISRGYDVSSLSGSSSCDLRLQTEVDSLFEKESPDIVIHLAGRVGGIGINKENPGRFLYDNLMMGANLIEKARQNNCKKFVMVGTVCSYPKYTEVPFKEDDIWNGYPEETNAPYGIAKKTLMQMIISYKEQYGFNGINLIPVNMYGPHDNFNPNSSHVIPAIILKIKNAMKREHHEDLEVWGTGSASREFLYVEDSAEAIISAMENLEDPRPVNIGTGNEIKIFDLVNMIADEMGFKGNIVWDKTKPDGQPRRCLDTSRAKELFGFEAKTSLQDGIRKTLEWYESL